MATFPLWPATGNAEGLTELKLLKASAVADLKMKAATADTSTWLDTETAPFAITTQVVDVKGPIQLFEYAQNMTETDQGQRFDWALAGNIPFASKQAESQLAWMAVEPMVAIIRTANGQCRLVGTSEFPLQLRYNADTTGYEIEIMGSSPVPALALASTLLASLGITSSGSAYVVW